MPEYSPVLLFPSTPGRASGASPEPSTGPVDRADRARALDVEHSWIVQAPAGAGKTELLTQRLLTLLAVVDEPEEILAITFTRAATGEMRGRVLAALERAAAEQGPGAGARLPEADRLGGPAAPDRTLALARAALARSDARGWRLLEQPHRLDIQTIDSLCLRLAHGQPLLARLGGRLEPSEQPGPFYAAAAQRTFGQLGEAPEELKQALSHLLLLRDNNLGDCQRLVAGMLAQRDHWRHILPLGAETALDWEALRAQLEAPFARAVQETLAALHAAMAGQPALVRELLELARYACANGGQDGIGLLDELDQLPGAHADFLEHWSCLKNFLLTQKGEWRRGFDKGDGFPTDGRARPRAEQIRYRQRILSALAELQRDGAAAESLRALLCSLAKLPATRYEDEQWRSLTAVFRVLRHAVAELHVIFAERNQVDFAELSIAAATLLAEDGDEEAATTRALLASESRKHLLIDEFQDTSRRQHQLIGRLLSEWQPGDGRTCFLVGDPLQSIYIFRQAEVELFGRVQRRGLDCGTRAHPCSQLTLSENFRSHAGLVEPLNRHFAAIFSSATGGLRGEVEFSPSSAGRPALAGESVRVHASFSFAREPASREAARDEQVTQVVELVEAELPRIREAELAGASGYTVAILGRARNHLTPIAAALRKRGIAYRAIELEALAERQEILDLLSLLRALLHPADRIAWLSVLRAPWCGLKLGDLHLLTGNDDRALRHALLPELIEQRAALLSQDGQRRLARTSGVMMRAASERFRRGVSLAAWLERAWTGLGAPAYLSATEAENARMFFQLLDELPPDGIDMLNGSLETALERLCAAPDASVSERFGVQLMTIHKAKGLGFEVVIVPALERWTGKDGSPLVVVLERARDGADEGIEDDEVLVAPLGRHKEKHRTYLWVQAQRQLREAAERKRLFYVACTRARERLHLLGTAEFSSAGKMKPASAESLLASAWPALEPLFAAQQAESTRPERGSALLLVAEPGPQAVPGLIPAIAAGAGAASMADDLASSDESGALTLWRVPADFAPVVPLKNVFFTGTDRSTSDQELRGQARFTRPEGSFEQRARGTAVHGMLELISDVWARAGRAGEPASLAVQLERAAKNVLRGAGLAPERAESLAASLVAVAVNAAASAEGRWLLAPRTQAKSEWSLSVQSPGGAGQLRVDRTFVAGAEVLSEGGSHLWIVDYKTGAAPGQGLLEAYLEAQRMQWSAQLAVYGAALREAGHGAGKPLRYALFFPELLRMVSWGE